MPLEPLINISISKSKSTRHCISFGIKEGLLNSTKCYMYICTGLCEDIVYGFY